MKYILDSHTFLWWHTNDSHLSSKAAAILSRTPHEVVFSMASVWEMQIKVQLGKLSVLPTLKEALELRLQSFLIQLLPIHSDHIFALNRLPTFADHRDPFDRLLVAQALHEGLAILSADTQITRYPVEIVW